LKDANPETLREFGIRRQAAGGALALVGLEPGKPRGRGRDRKRRHHHPGRRPAGAGKTTLQEILSKSLDPDPGVLLLLERGSRRTFRNSQALSTDHAADFFSSFAFTTSMAIGRTETTMIPRITIFTFFWTNGSPPKTVAAPDEEPDPHDGAKHIEREPAIS